MAAFDYHLTISMGHAPASRLAKANEQAMLHLADFVLRCFCDYLDGAPASSRILDKRGGVKDLLAELASLFGSVLAGHLPAGLANTCRSNQAKLLEYL